MGNYATTADLKARFEDDAAVAFLTDTADSGTPDNDVLNEVINHAEGQVDAYSAVRFKVPLDVGDNAGLAAMMKSVTLDIAEYHLLARGRNVQEVTTAIHDKAIEWLKEIAAGTVMLPSAETEASTTSRTPLIAFGTANTTSDSSRRIMTRETQGAL